MRFDGLPHLSGGVSSKTECRMGRVNNFSLAPVPATYISVPRYEFAKLWTSINACNSGHFLLLEANAVVKISIAHR